MGYFEDREELRKLRLGMTAPSASSSQREYTYGGAPLDSGAKLTRDDLLKPEYNNVLRDYMVDRMGVQYKDEAADKVADDFVEHMRFFNANTVHTAGEAIHISRADDYSKQVSNEAYKIYDNLGMFWESDGITGAAEGAWEYAKAIATDPTNYIGLITGGASRLIAGGASLTGKKMIQSAVIGAGREALKSGATKAAAQRAGQEAGVEAARRLVAQGYRTRVAGEAYAKVAKQVEQDVARGLARQAMQRAQQEGFKEAGKKAVIATTGLDASFAVLQDLQIQSVYMQAGAQEQYSALQTGFSALGGSIGGLAHLAGGAARGISNLTDDAVDVAGISEKAVQAVMPKLNKEQSTKAQKEIIERIKDWADKVKDGKASTPGTVPTELLREIVIGTKNAKGMYEGGILGAYKEAGVVYNKNQTISDAMTDFVYTLDAGQLKEINDVLRIKTGINLGDMTENAAPLSDLLAKEFSNAGSSLQVMSHFRKSVDAGLVAAEEAMAKDMAAIDLRALVDETSSPDYLRYGQTVWKRLLVSSPATTVANVAGFGTFAAGQTMADLFNATALVGAAVMKAPFNKQAASESLRRARALTTLQAQKLRNLMDPFTTHDVYMEFLSKHSDVEKALFESVSAGVERGSKRFNIPQDAGWFNKVEAFTTAANQVTGVRIQDSFTKSQMFMSELDKALRINKKMTLREALKSGDDTIFDDRIIGSALDTTMRSVFSKDYTTESTNELFRNVAKITETISNAPGIGTILPFGRFFNNVLATTYQWSPLAAPQLLGKFMKKTIAREKMELSEMDAVARMMVGTSAMYLAMQFDERRREKGLAYNEVDTGNGTIVDIKNVYPLSVFALVGRVANLHSRGEMVPKELKTEITNVLGVGQLSRDMQFGNDLVNVMDVFFNTEDGARTGDASKGAAKVIGNFAAGFTRPLDAINKVVGFATGTDAAKDIRQAQGFGSTFTQSATKYVDNIFEAFLGKTDTLTGEELRVATREGSVYDPNPFARIFGITTVQSKTSTEQAYTMAEMLPWTASERTDIPTYDRMFNTMLAPVLEMQTNQLVRSERFKNASLTGRRDMLKAALSEAKKQVTKRIERGYAGSDAVRLRMVRKAQSTGNQELRREALGMLRDRFNVTASERDMNVMELDLYIDLIESLKEAYRQ